MRELLNDVSTYAVSSEAMVSFVTTGKHSSRHAWGGRVGIGSSTQYSLADC